MLGRKASLYKFQKTEVILSIFFDYSGIKLGKDNRNNLKLLNIEKLSKLHLHSPHKILIP